MIEFTGARFFERRLIRRVESAVYAVLGQRDIFTVDLAVTDGETVRQFNRETRGVDSETDVLSFPYFDGLVLPVTAADFSDEAFDGKRVALGSIMISSELPELLGMCDRIYVMNEGRLLAEVNAADATQESIMGYIIRDTAKA